MILVVAATQDELRGAWGGSTLVCGVGPVEAAARTAAELHAVQRLKAVLNVGIAGARTFDEPEAVLGTEAIYCDADDPRWIELHTPADATALAGVPAIEVRVLANAIGEADRRQWRFDEAKALLAELLPGLIRELAHA